MFFRTQGSAVCQLVSRLGSIAAPFVSDILSQVYTPLPYFLMAGVCGCAALGALTLDETIGKPLREDFSDFRTGE